MAEMNVPVDPLLRFASRWILRDDNTSFEISADLMDLIASHGPGMYTVVLFAGLKGESEAVSSYSVRQW